MSDQTQFVDYTELESALRDLGSAVDWPRTPDLTAAVSARLTTAPRSTLAWPWRRSLTRSLLLAAAVALLVAGVAVGIRFGLDLLQIEFGPVPTVTPGASFSSRLQLGELTSLDSAEANAAFPIVVPNDPGAPDAVYVGGPELRGQVAFVYAAGNGLPESGHLDGAGLLITQNRGSIDRGLARKVVDAGGTVEMVRVGEHVGYWFTGNPHGFWYFDRDGRVIAWSGRVTGNTLAWQRGDILYRIEGDISLERALEIAESMP
jgi:hypothetical protein